MVSHEMLINVDGAWNKKHSYSALVMSTDIYRVITTMGNSHLLTGAFGY